MTAALLSIGSELLRGEIVNSNAAWLADQLTHLGFHVVDIETVGDDQEAVISALRRLGETYGLVIATGGLGPTSDDLTAAAAARLLGVELELNEDALAAIRRRLTERGRELKPCHEKQARLPQGSDMLPNTEGTAPGFVLCTEGWSAYVMPGVPYEMRRMFMDEVAPRIRKAADKDRYQVRLHTCGAGESIVSDRLEGLEAKHAGVTLGYLAATTHVDVVVAALGADYAEARDRAEAAAAEARERLADVLYGEGDDTMVLVAGRAVRSRGWRLGVAESCTGGLLAQQLTAIPASDYFVGAAVTYANSAKSALLGVSEDTLRGHGAVSAEVVAEMAEGARRTFRCEVGIGVTGIAGPTGATADKPVGLCFWSVAHPGGTVVEQCVFAGHRNQVQEQAAFAALDLLRRTIANG